MAKYPVILIPDDDGGYVVECPTIPGSVSQGETVEEALDDIKDVIRGCIEVRRELDMVESYEMGEVEVDV